MEPTQECKLYKGCGLSARPRTHARKRAPANARPQTHARERAPAQHIYLALVVACRL